MIWESVVTAFSRSSTCSKSGITSSVGGGDDQGDLVGGCAAVAVAIALRALRGRGDTLDRAFERDIRQCRERDRGALADSKRGDVHLIDRGRDAELRKVGYLDKGSCRCAAGCGGGTPGGTILGIDGDDGTGDGSGDRALVSRCLGIGHSLLGICQRRLCSIDRACSRHNRRVPDIVRILHHGLLFCGLGAVPGVQRFLVRAVRLVIGSIRIIERALGGGCLLLGLRHGAVEAVVLEREEDIACIDGVAFRDPHILDDAIHFRRHDGARDRLGRA